MAARPAHLLIKAAEAGNLPVVQWCFDHSPEEMIPAAFHYGAVLQGHQQVVEFFLDKKPELLNQPYEGGYTALIRAAKEGQLAIVALLLEKGADATKKDEQGFSALEYAWNNSLKRSDSKKDSNTYMEIICLLIEKGNARATGSIGKQALIWAARSGNVQDLAMLLQKGKDKTIHAATKTGRTSLMLASEFYHPAVAHLLLSNEHLAINATDDRGRTALIWAAKHNCLPLVEALLAKRAATDTKDRQGSTALDELMKHHEGMPKRALEEAMQKNHAKVVDLILRSHAPELESIFRSEIFRWAHKNGHKEIKEFLKNLKKVLTN